MPDLTPYRRTLLDLTRSDPDPRVRHRADALVLLADGMTQTAVARVVHTSPGRIRAWRDRFLSEGRTGLADRPRLGRPRKLDAQAEVLLEQFLARSPLEVGYPVATWTVADLTDLTDLLQRHGWSVSRHTVSRSLRRLGYRYRRPRHDLTHRQDAEAVVSAKHALAELQKRGLLPGLDSAWSTWMNVTSTPILTWQKSGSGGDNR